MARKLELDLVAKSNADVVLNRVQKAANNFSTGLVSKFAGAFGAMALFDKALNFGIETFKEFAGLADQISKSGLASDQFQQLAYAAKQSGADVKDVTKAVRELNSAISDAKISPEGKKGQALRALGFSPEQIASGTIKATDVFIQLSRAMEQASNDADKVAIATALLGDKVGQNLIPMLEGGEKSMRKLFGDAPIVPDQVLKRIDDTNDKFDTLIARIKALYALNAGDILSGDFSKIGKHLLAPLSVATTISNATDILQKPGEANTSNLPAPDAQALINSQAKANAEANASMGSGVIGVGASPQVALQQEANTTLTNIDSKLGLLVNAGIDKDPTKPLNRKFPLYSPGLQR